ncbi:hypothetical protein N9A56_07340 [Planktomarina temperata]|nr:hypothetical protein [Planktomarina temperata]
MNKKVKNLCAVYGFLLLITYSLLPSIAEANSSCTATSTYGDHMGGNSASDENDGYCLSTPSSLVLKIYEFAICTSEPNPSNTSMCTKIFEKAAGEDFDLSAGASLSMADNLSIEEETYTHAYVTLSNVTTLKSTLDFSPNTRFDLDGREGKFCFTDGRKIKETYSIITCANTAAPLYSEETISLGDDSSPYYNGTIEDYPAVVGSTTILTDLYMLDVNGKPSQAYTDDFAIMGAQELSTAVTINAATTNLDIGFSVTNGMSFGFIENGDSEGGQTCNQAAGCLNDAVFDGLKFLVKAE